MQRRVWMDWGNAALGWVSRITIAVGAGALAFVVVPLMSPASLVVIVAAAWALFQLMGFGSPKARLLGRLVLASVLIFALVPDAFYPPAFRISMLRLLLAGVLWHSLGIVVDVLEVPRPEDWREKRAALSEAQVLY